MMSHTSIQPSSNSYQPTFDSYRDFTEKFVTVSTTYQDKCLFEASRQANRSYSKKELTQRAQEIANNFFEEFKLIVLSNTNQMTEQFESQTYLEVAHTQFVWKLKHDIEEILSGKSVLKWDDE